MFCGILSMIKKLTTKKNRKKITHVKSPPYLSWVYDLTSPALYKYGSNITGDNFSIIFWNRIIIILIIFRRVMFQMSAFITDRSTYHSDMIYVKIAFNETQRY